MSNYAPAQLAEWERDGGQKLDYNRGLIQIHSEADHEHLINLPNRLVVVETTKEGISAVKDIQKYYEKLANENPDYVFGQFACEKIPSLAARMNIFPVFKFFVNGQMIQQCYGGQELGLKTNFDRAIILYKKIMNPPKKKDIGTPEDLSTFGRKVVTAKGERDETWVPDNMRVTALPQRAADDGAPGVISPRQKATAFVNIDLDNYTQNTGGQQVPQARVAAAPTFLTTMPQRIDTNPPPQQQQQQPQTYGLDRSASAPRQQPMQQQPQQQNYSAQVSYQNTAVSPRQQQANVNVNVSASSPQMGGGGGGIPQLATICPGGEFVWALDVNGGVWRWSGSEFEKIPGKLRSLAVGSDGAVWGTDHQENIYRRTQNGWQQVRGRLASVAVGNQNNVWGITPDGQTVRYLGGGQWEPVTAFMIPQ